MDEASAELLERYRQGDGRAADVLFHRYVERLTAMVQRQLHAAFRRRIDPEDAVHSAYRSFFVQARQGEFALEHAGDLWKLLVTITLNKLRRQIAHHRAGKRAVGRDRSADGAMLARADGPSPLEALAAADELEVLMTRLTPEQRTVLEMRLQDRSWAEIAAVVGRSERTVRRAIEEIRTIWRRDVPHSLEIGWQSRPAANLAPATTHSTDSETLLDYGDFLLNELVGRGGMGKVYRAVWKSRNQRVAVKVLHKPRWTSPAAVERFMEEARTVARLRHPGIVGVHGVGRTPGGGLFLVMDFIDGADLAQVSSEQRPSPRQAAAWVAEAARAVAHAHAHGVVHCDLKPSNLMRDNGGRIVVGDFGLARSFGDDTRSWGGTLGYMAPEQLDASFGEVGPAADIFALGLVLVNLLTGRVVFEGKRVMQALADPACPPDWWRSAAGLGIPEQLVAVLNRCLAIDPLARFPTAAQLADALAP